MIPTLEQAKVILNKYVKKQEFLTHNLEVGRAMRALAVHYKEDPDFWQTIGILHDIDIELYGDKLEDHTIKGEKILQSENVDQSFIDIIKSHNGEYVNIKRTKLIEHCLYAADGLTGLIHAYVLMRPDKDIQQGKVKSVMKKYKDKAFARGVSREEIKSVETTLNIEVQAFIEIVLEGMKKFD
jgi:putative nucleotidyltransferase with HDIG domain